MAILYKPFGAFRTVFCAVFCIAIISCASAPAVNAASPVFTIEDVKVDVTAENASVAREQAFEQAQVKAFEDLAKRMLSENEFKNFKPPAGELISTMIQDFEITNEQLSSVRYIGTYTFRFRDEDVRHYFSKSGVSYTDVGSRPMLALPFMEKDGQTILWSPYNSWMQAWARIGDMKGLVPITVPLGDLMDVKDVKDNHALNYDEVGLSDMLDRYESGEAVILIAVPDATLASVHSDSAPGAGALTVNVYRTDRAGPEYVTKIIVNARQGQTRGQMFETAAAQAHEALQKNWKQQTAITTAPEAIATGNRALALVRFSTLDEWASIQHALNRAAGVQDITLKSLSPGQAIVEILYQGDERRLQLALQQSSLTLTVARSVAAGTNAPPYELTMSRSITSGSL